MKYNLLKNKYIVFKNSSYPPSRRFRSHGWGFFAPALDIVLVYMAREGEEEGMALARGGWAVLLAEGTLQEQL